jgi:hypothetical protein
VRFIVDIAIMLLVAAVLGIASAWLAVDRGPLFGALRLGAWTAWPRVGPADADPYSDAVLAHSGELPLGSGEGLAFTAEADDLGEPLVGSCSYEISGQTPPARLWTLTAYDQEGRLFANPARRSSFHSREILRRGDGTFVIAVSPEVQPGNWLPVVPRASFRLVVRLYDTPLTSRGQTPEATMPAIRRTACP